jgi:hypothetical protein
MLGGLDKEEDSLLSYDDQLSLAQKEKLILKSSHSRQNNIRRKEIHHPIIIQISKMKIKITKGLRKLSEC